LQHTRMTLPPPPAQDSLSASAARAEPLDAAGAAAWTPGLLVLLLRRAARLRRLAAAGCRSLAQGAPHTVLCVTLLAHYRHVLGARPEEVLSLPVMQPGCGACTAYVTGARSCSDGVCRDRRGAPG